MIKGLFSIVTSLFSILISGVSFYTIRRVVKESSSNTTVPTLPEDNLPFVSVIIPARNEETHIETTLISVLNQKYPRFEVIVVNDNSTDSTGAILNELKLRYPQNLQVVNNSPCPEGWDGKSFAVWQGFKLSSPEAQWLLLLDADTTLKPGALEYAVSSASVAKVDLFSLIPLVKNSGFWPKVLMAEIYKFYVLAGNNPLNPLEPGSVEEASANGAFILARREAYQKVGGHQTIRHSVTDDRDLAILFRQNGFTTLQTTGFEQAEMPWYENLADLWEGVSKNLFMVARKKWSTVALTVGLEGFYALLPVGICIWQTPKPAKKGLPRLAEVLNITAVIFMLVVHGEANRQVGVPRRYALLYPMAALLSSLVFLNSAVRVTFGKAVAWKGRKISL